MKIDGEHLQSIWYDKESDTVKIIDQTLLPHKFKVVDLKNLSDACNAINSMNGPQVKYGPKTFFVSWDVEDMNTASTSWP